MQRDVQIWPTTWGMVVLFLGLVGSAASIGAEHRVTSPDGSVVVTVSDEEGLRYRVDVDGQPVLDASALGLEFDNGVSLGRTTQIAIAERSDHDGSWENAFGKRRIVRDHWNQLALQLNDPQVSDSSYGLLVRVFDDGVAFRYTLPADWDSGEVVLTRELTEFAFHEDYRCWAGEPSKCAENQYPECTLSTIPQFRGDGEFDQQPYLSVLPLLVQTPNCYVAVAESDLLDWAGIFLTGSGSSTMRVTLADRNDGRGCVVAQPPCSSPWRVLMIARTSAELISSDLIATLATPCRLDDTAWIKPGISAWDAWWTGQNPYLPEYEGVLCRGDTRSHKEYIDFAAEMGWSYQLVDWYWYKNMSSHAVALNLGGEQPSLPPVDFAKSMPYIDLPTILAHAKKKGIRPLIWLHSYDLHRYGIDRACGYFAGLGAAGLKIDFMNSDSQETVQWYVEVIQTAAKHRLLINFHGAYKPTGLARTWPNYITQEGVLGNEYNKLQSDTCSPRHTITLPFTCGLLGPMDFTPGGFLNRTAAEFQITQPAEVIGSRSRQLAMAVVYESPLLVLCDRPIHYRGAPGIEFFRGLPTVWDETVVCAAEVAEHVVIARRSGDRWWLAAMNGEEPLELAVRLDFLRSGTWSLRSFADTPDSGERPTELAETTRVVSGGETLKLRLVTTGGFAGVFAPANENFP